MGNFRTQTLTEVMLDIGADRVLYSVDYPFEDMTPPLTGSIRLQLATQTAKKIAATFRQEKDHEGNYFDSRSGCTCDRHGFSLAQEQIDRDHTGPSSNRNVNKSSVPLNCRMTRAII